MIGTLSPVDRARAYVAACPGAVSGAGGHDATFGLVMALAHGFCLGEHEIWPLLHEYNARCLPPWNEGELHHKLRSAFCTAPAKPRGWLLEGRDQLPPLANAPPKWPARNEAAIRAVTADGPGLADLWENSPVRFEENASRAEELIDALFPSNPLLCCAPDDQRLALTQPRAAWRGDLARLSFIVPSPMTAPSGTNLEGRESPRCLDNTGPRRFLVVEFDHGGIDEQAAILWHLAARAPLALAVHSGGKSLHGWFYCAGQPEEKIKRFFRYAVSLGADFHLWNRAQLVRLPDGTRANGQRQTVFYSNPATIQYEHIPHN